MPPGFTTAEKARITGLLLDNGQRLFITQGLRKTSLDELITGTGIAKSTFYAFFDSKEALYLELMFRQMAEVKRKVIDEALLSSPDPREGIRSFLHATIAQLETNALYRRLMTHPEEMDAVARRLDPERVTAAPENPVTALADFITGNRERLVPAEPAVIVGVLQSVLFVPMNAARLGAPELLTPVLDLLIDIVAAGLTAEKE